jgi:ribose-phosphate pyrophosphokinase
MYVLNGTTNKSIAENLANALKCPLAQATIKRFPDKEFYVRILDNLNNEQVIIVQSTYPDEKIVELILLKSAVKQAGAQHITVVIPYYGYSRQDKKFKEGEVISAQILAQHIQVDIDKIITVDPHKDYILDFFSIPAFGVSATTELVKYLKQKNIDLLLAPDKGALPHTKEAAALIGCESDYIEKTRIDGNTVEMKPKNLQVKGKNVAIIDDIISTGGTMALAIQELKKQEADKVYAACTHGLFIGTAVEKLQRAGCDEIIASDTIQNKYTKISTAPCILTQINKK